jgi:hypothetical protein
MHQHLDTSWLISAARDESNTLSQTVSKRMGGCHACFTRLASITTALVMEPKISDSELLHLDSLIVRYA